MVAGEKPLRSLAKCFDEIDAELTVLNSSHGLGTALPCGTGRMLSRETEVLKGLYGDHGDGLWRRECQNRPS